jgi:hypothetical protein
MRRGLTAAVVAGVCGIAVPAAGDDVKHPLDFDIFDLRLEGGSEYDSNIHRLEVPDGEDVEVAGAPLMRAAARVRTGDALSERTRWRVSAVAAAKLFLGSDGQSENVAITAGDGLLDHRLEGRPALIGLRASYYEAYGYDTTGGGNAGEGRNFGMVVADVTTTVLGPDNHRLSASLGVREFRYKPDADFDWAGPQTGLQYRTTMWRGDPDEDLEAASIDVDVRYDVGLRGYQGRAFTNNCADGETPTPMCIVPTVLARQDLHHQVRAELVYTGERVWSGAYELQATDSNSFGQSLVRHRLELGVTTQTWLDVYATARLALLVNTFVDPLLLARDVNSQTFLTIDDENRNTASLHLSRDLNRHWTAEARYALYTNEFATELLRFRRHLAYAGLAYRY